MCILVLSGCGKGETEEQDIQIPAEPENTKYKMEELILPDFFSAQEEEHEFEYEEEKDALFDGFVSDLQGKPAVYASSFTLEEEEYLADIARWHHIIVPGKEPQLGPIFHGSHGDSW